MQRYIFIKNVYLSLASSCTVFIGCEVYRISAGDRDREFPIYEFAAVASLIVVYIFG